MKMNYILIGIAFILTAVLTSVITYVVDDHFDYVVKLEEKVIECDGENVELEQENLNLKSSLVEPPLK